MAAPLKRPLLFAGIVALVLWLTPTPALAHAGIVSSNPEPGAELGSAPAIVTLRFSEPLNERLSRAEVLSPDGTRFEGSPQPDGEIAVRLTTNAPGIYRVTWTTVSSVDGHTLDGSFEFGVGVRPASQEGQTSTSPGLIDTSIAIARAVEDGALLLAIGLLLVRRLGPDLSWLRIPVVPVIAVALAGGVGVVLGEAFSAARTPSLSAIGAYLFSGLPGFARTARIVLEAVALLVALRRPALIALPVTAALVALAAAGHAAAVPPRWLSVSVEAVHLVAVAAWAGGIMALAFQRPPGGWLGQQGTVLLRRFTPPALVAFTATAATGVFRAAQELGSFGELLRSGYGLVLVVKTLLVVLMAQLSLFAWRRIVVKPRAEAALAVGVIGAAAMLAAFPLPPARVQETETQEIRSTVDLALPRPGELTLGGHAGEVLVGLTVRPRDGGAEDLLVYLQDLGTKDSTAARVVTIQVDGQAVGVTQCGPTCRRTSADVNGGESVDIDVGGYHGGSVRFHLPDLPGPSAADVVAEMMRQMHSLDSYRLDESLTSGLGSTVRATYQFLAPDRYTSRVEQDGGEASATIVIGGTRYLRSSHDGRWEKQMGAPPLDVPSFIWDSFQPFTDPHVVGHESLDGVSTTEVAFFGGSEQGTPVWFRLWIDDRGLVRRAEMRAQGHFMDHRYYDFDVPITIRPPTT